MVLEVHPFVLPVFCKGTCNIFVAFGSGCGTKNSIHFACILQANERAMEKKVLAYISLKHKSFSKLFPKLRL